jgi:flagellar motor switch protein FliM
MPAKPRTAEGDYSQQPDERLCQPLVPGQLGRETIGIVEKIHASFLKSLEVELAELLQTSVAVSRGESAQAAFSKVLDETDPDDRVIGLDLAPTRALGFLTFPAQLLFRVLDILLAAPEGNPGETSYNDSRRAVTGIELHILREFFDAFTQSLRKAWEPFCPAAFNQINAGEEAGLRATYGDDPALILSATISVGREPEALTTEVRFVVSPFLARLAQMKSTSASHASPSESFRGGVLNSLGGATLRLEAVLDGGSIRIGSLLDLAPGQILVLGNPEGSSVDCLVNNRRQFTGELVAANGRCAIQIDALPSAGQSGAKSGTKPADRVGKQFVEEVAADR